MTSGPVSRLPGMRDLQEEGYLRLRGAQEVLQGVFSSYGYRIVEPPLLELTETFSRKAGELASRLYSFQEPGGHNATLRPEFTPSVIRIFQEQGEHQSLPVRWQYGGPVFRHYPEDSHRLRQFWQAGVELVGAAGAHADAEVIALASKGLAALGAPDVQVVLGDMAVLRSFLERSGVSERAQRFLLRHLPSLKGRRDRVQEIRDQAKSVGLLRERRGDDEIRQMLARLAALEQSDASENGPGLSARHLPSRTPEEIAQRLNRRLGAPDEAARFDQAADMLYHLAQLAGEPGPVLAEATRIARANQVHAEPIIRFAQALETVRRHNQQHSAQGGLRVDLGLTHGIAYYTGVVFELRCAAAGGAALGAGGRYDGLLKALGASEDVPAIGFALPLDQVVEALSATEEHSGQRRARRVLVVPASPAAYAASLRTAETLRLAGEVVEQALVERPLAQHQQYARSKKLDAVVVVTEGGESERYAVEGVQGEVAARPAQRR